MSDPIDSADEMRCIAASPQSIWTSSVAPRKLVLDVPNPLRQQLCRPEINCHSHGDSRPTQWRVSRHQRRRLSVQHNNACRQHVVSATGNSELKGNCDSYHDCVCFLCEKSFHSQSLFISKHCHVLLITEWLTGITGVFVLQFTNLLRLKHDYEHVSVCLPTCISQELVTQTSPSFTRMLPVAVARLFADICCQITKTTC